MKNMIIHAIQEQRKLEIIYMDSDNRFSQRVIRPVKISETWVLAYCYRKRRLRTFRLDNILSADHVRKKPGA